MNGRERNRNSKSPASFNNQPNNRQTRAFVSPRPAPILGFLQGPAMAPLDGGTGPPPLPASSSPSSSLSPLAPPFTIGSQPPSRRFPSNLDRNPAHPASPATPTPQTSRQYPDWSSLSLAPHQFQHSLDTSPCYSRYSHPIVGVNAADPFDCLPEMGSEYPRAAMGSWRAAFDGQKESRGAPGGEVVSSWMEPSLDYKVSSFQEGGTTDRLISYQNTSGVWHGKHSRSLITMVNFDPDCSDWLNNGIPRNSEENTIAPYHISGASVLDSSSSDEGMLYSPISKSFSTIESRSKSHSNSYDGYIAYPAKTCSTSAQVHAPSSRRISLVRDYSILNHVYPVVQDINPYKTNNYCGECVYSDPGECDTNQNVEVKEGCDEMTRKDNVKEYNHMTANPFSLKSGLSSGNGLATWDSMETSKGAKSVSELKILHLPNAFSSESSPAEANDSAGSSSQTLEQLNLAVDSPCWKGVKGSQNHAFSETEGLCPATIESKEYDDLSVAYSETVPSFEQVGTLIPDKNRKTFSESYLREPFSVSLPSMQQNFDDSDKGAPDCFKDVEKGLFFPGVCKDQGDEVGKELHVDSETDAIEVNRSGKEECDQTTTGDGIANLLKDLKPSVHDDSCDGKSLPKENYRKLLVKTMHTLSETLLCSYNGGTTELKEHDYELLKLVIQNIEALSRSNKKAIQSQGTSLTIDAIMNHAENKSTHEMKTKMHSLGSSANSGFVGGATELNKINGVAQVIEKVLEKTLFDPEENPQALVYKNLWIEAEAALCTMKYELQLLHMKVTMEDHKNQAKDFPGRSQQVNSLASLKPTHLEVHPSLMKVKERFPNDDLISSFDVRKASNRKPLEAPPNANKTEEIDASVLARFKVLRERVYKPGPTSDGQKMLAVLDNAGTSVEAEVTSCIMCSEGGSGEQEHLPTQLADLGFMENRPQPNTDNYAHHKGNPRLIRINLHGGNYNKAFASDL